SAQESTLRHISRELHDEFGQVLTAIGSMLGRAGSRATEDPRLREDLQEVREIAQASLDKIRTLSQALHPVLLEEAGLSSTLDWYIPTVERQTGLGMHYEKKGQPFPIETGAGVRIQYSPEGLMLEVEDRGQGIKPNKGHRGIGLVAMRERAEILGGTLEIARPEAGGTLVRLRVPREKVEAHAE